MDANVLHLKVKKEIQNMQNQEKYNPTSWLDDAMQQMPELIPGDAMEYDGMHIVLDTISGMDIGVPPVQVCTAVTEAINMPGVNVLRRYGTALKTIRSALSVIKDNKYNAVHKNSIIAALTVIFSACQPGNVLHNTKSGQFVEENYSSANELASTSTEMKDQLVNLVMDDLVRLSDAKPSDSASIGNNRVDSAEKKTIDNYPHEINIRMSDIGNADGMWGTDAGRKLLDSLVDFYAGYRMNASFDNIQVAISRVPNGDIETYCVDPDAKKQYDTEYACTVNTPEQHMSVIPAIGQIFKMAREKEIAAREYARKNKRVPVDSILLTFDGPQLNFHIYVDDSLPHIQVKQLIVHELKHCVVQYAVAQRIVSLYVREDNVSRTIEYIKKLSSIVSVLNKQLSDYIDIDSEKFNPEIPYESKIDIIPFIKSRPALKPENTRSP
jgi:hypothetical protein